jgi:Recombinase
MLKSPCYAGAFAYGKTAVRTRIEEGRVRQSSRYRKPHNEWKVLLIGHHPGHISWEEYLENQHRLEDNVASYEGVGSGAAKMGALCCPACCAAVSAAGNCKLSIAAAVVACQDMSVGAIGEIANPAGA